MTTQYDDLILKHTGNWKNTDAIVTKVGGDKSAIVQAIKRLVDMDYLENSPNKNKILYKRKGTAQSEFNFLSMMDNFEVNQKIELNRLKQIPTLMMLDGKRLRAKGIELMENILEEVNRAYMVKSRLIYQKNSSLIPSDVAEERIKKLDNYVEKIMSTVMSKHTEKNAINTIQEYLQNHIGKFEFKT